MKKLITFILFAQIAFAQKGGLNYPTLTVRQASQQGYILITNADSLAKYAKISNSKLFISAGFNIAQRCTVSGNNVIIESDKKSTITSTVWLAPFRLCETILLTGRGVTLKGLRLKGASKDILTLDTSIYQEAIRLYADSISIINCTITNFDFAGIYGHRFNGCNIEQCYIARCKRSGFGYGVWFEGKPGNVGVVKNCIFEDNREDIDAGGQKTVWTADGCITTKGITSHVDPNQQSGIGITAINNYIVSGSGVMSFPYPAVDTGWTTITDNFTFRDSGAFSVHGAIRPKAKITISNNHFGNEGMNLPVCELRIDSVWQTQVRFTILSLYKICEIDFGDGTDPVIAATGSLVHKYSISGSYCIGARVFDNRSVPSAWVYKKIIIGTGLGFAFKTTARFTPGLGYYAVQLLIDDSVYLSMDATKYWSWKRIARSYPLTGAHKVAIRIACLKDCTKAIQVWFDDIDYGGRVANSGFDEDAVYYHPPYSLWKQKLSGIGGSGIDEKERCGGTSSWRFEGRGTIELPIKAGSYSEIYQTILF